MIYAKIDDGRVVSYPLYLADIRRMHPDMSLPVRPSSDDLSAMGYFVVSPVSPPEIDHTQNVQEIDPVRGEDGWRRAWAITPASPSQVTERTQTQSTNVRAERNARLAACDWTQLDDTPMANTQKAAWAIYRQQLRDVTAQEGFPWAVEWPSLPSGT